MRFVFFGIPFFEAYFVGLVPWARILVGLMGDTNICPLLGADYKAIGVDHKLYWVQFTRFGDFIRPTGWSGSINLVGTFGPIVLSGSTNLIDI